MEAFQTFSRESAGEKQEGGKRVLRGNLSDDTLVRESLATLTIKVGLPSPGMRKQARFPKKDGKPQISKGGKNMIEHATANRERQGRRIWRSTSGTGKANSAATAMIRPVIPDHGERQDARRSRSRWQRLEPSCWHWSSRRANSRKREREGKNMP